ncbi:MAG: hypothetical protein LBO69_06600 [Ignavibacteria bacterium]|jgi:hypothetical protein|nr:hypothetical protein [Ignavibacteria bacterium]
MENDIITKEWLNANFVYDENLKMWRASSDVDGKWYIKRYSYEPDTFALYLRLFDAPHLRDLYAIIYKGTSIQELLKHLSGLDDGSKSS